MVIRKCEEENFSIWFANLPQKHALSTKIQIFSAGGISLESVIKQLLFGNLKLHKFLMRDMSGGKRVETMQFYVGFAFRCSHFLKHLRAFLRQQKCSVISILFDHWWFHSTPSKRSTDSNASKEPLTYSFDPPSINQQQCNCFNSWLQSRPPHEGRERGRWSLLFYKDY